MRRHIFSILILACGLFSGGCVDDMIKDDQLEQVSGNYSMISLSIDGKEVSVNRMSPPEVLVAGLYSSDDRWFFDCVLPDTDYHGGFEFKKIVFPVNWNTALGKMEFLSTDIQSFPNIDKISFENGTITVTTSEVQDIYNIGRVMNRVHTVTCTWKKDSK